MSDKRCICRHPKYAHTEDESKCKAVDVFRDFEGDIEEELDCDCHGFTPEDGYSEWNS
jgi:hypothetical protein